MRLNLPIIGQLTIGRDQKSELPNVTRVDIPEDRKKFLDTLGGLLQFGSRSLSNQRTISSKLLEANKEWVYRNNDVIAQEVSQIEFQLYSVGLSKGEIVFIEMEDHPLLDLLDRFNAETTKMDGIYITQSDKKMAGDAFWYLERNGKSIENIRILIPDQVEIEFNDPGNDSLIRDYKYIDTVDNKRVEVIYQPQDIIHFKKPNPRNPFRGKGAVEALADTIDADNLANLTQSNFFEKGAISNFVLTTDANLTQDQLKRLKAEFRSAYTGARNAYSTMIFGNGLKPSDIGFSNRDMQFLDILEWYRDKIMIGFGNTKASIGIIDDVNRASFAESHAAWLNSTVKPDMDAIVNTINEFLVPKFGDRLILGYKNPIQEDRTADVKEASDLKKAGIITINEAREIVDFDPVDGGDIFAPDSPTTLTPGQQDINGNTTPEADKPKTPDEGQPQDGEKAFRRPRYQKPYSRSLKHVPPALAHLNVEQMLRKRKIFTVRNANKELKESVKPLIRKMLNGKKKTTPEEPRLHSQFSNEQVNSYYQKQMNVVDVMEGRFEKAVEAYIGKIERDTMNNLEQEISSMKGLKAPLKSKQFFDEKNLLLEAQLDLYPVLMEEVILAGQEAFRLIGSEDVYIPFKLREVVRGNVAKFAQSMLDTDQQTITDLITDGIDDGSTITEIRDSIQSRFKEITRIQAERVTRTEVLRASNMAAEDAFIQSGVVEAKQWLVAPGAEAKCLQYAGKIVKLKGNFYEADDSGFQDGNPPLHVHCRCVIIPIVIGATAYKQDITNEISGLQDKIGELESQVDKRTKAFKQLKAMSTDDKAYILSLEKLVGKDK